MMKKVLAVALSLTLVFASLAGCKKETKKSDGKLTLAEYRGLEVYESDLDIDDQYDSTIQQFLAAKETSKKVEKGKVRETDTVNIDYTGTIDGFAFDGGTAQGYDLDIDNSSFIEGFAEGLVGKKVGETVDLNLTFPDDYTGTAPDEDGNEMKLAGRDVLFKTTINYRTVTKTPEYNDDFVKENYSAIGSTVEEMDKYVKRQLKVSAAMSQIWEDFLDDCEIDAYPEQELESYRTALNENYIQQLQSYYQTDLKTYLEACGMTQDDWDKEMDKSSKDAIKQQMVIDKIAEKEKVAVTKESKNLKKLEEQLAQMNGLENAEALVSQYGEDTVLRQLNFEAVQGVIYDNLKVNKGERPTEEPTAAETTAADETPEETEKATE